MTSEIALFTILDTRTNILSVVEIHLTFSSIVYLGECLFRFFVFCLSGQSGRQRQLLLSLHLNPRSPNTSPHIFHRKMDLPSTSKLRVCCPFHFSFLRLSIKRFQALLSLELYQDQHQSKLVPVHVTKIIGPVPTLGSLSHSLSSSSNSIYTPPLQSSLELYRERTSLNKVLQELPRLHWPRMDAAQVL